MTGRLRRKADAIFGVGFTVSSKLATAKAKGRGSNEGRESHAAPLEAFDVDRARVISIAVSAVFYIPCIRPEQQQGRALSRPGGHSRRYSQRLQSGRPHVAPTGPDVSGSHRGV